MEKWLRCKIAVGQFPDEYAVFGHLFDDHNFSLFAGRTEIEFEQEPSKGHPVDGRIRVRPLEQKGRLCLVAMPHPTLENGQTVTVEESLLDPTS